MNRIKRRVGGGEDGGERAETPWEAWRCPSAVEWGRASAAAAILGWAEKDRDCEAAWMGFLGAAALWLCWAGWAAGQAWAGELGSSGAMGTAGWLWIPGSVAAGAGAWWGLARGWLRVAKVGRWQCFSELASAGHAWLDESYARGMSMEGFKSEFGAHAPRDPAKLSVEGWSLVAMGALQGQRLLMEGWTPRRPGRAREWSKAASFGLLRVGVAVSPLGRRARAEVRAAARKGSAEGEARSWSMFPERMALMEAAELAKASEEGSERARARPRARL